MQMIDDKKYMMERIEKLPYTKYKQFRVDMSPRKAFKSVRKI